MERPSRTVPPAAPAVHLPATPSRGRDDCPDVAMFFRLLRGPGSVDPTPNLKLLHRVRDLIERHPRRWNQEYWRVLRFDPIFVPTWLLTRTARHNTTFCFAGLAIECSGLRWAKPLGPYNDPEQSTCIDYDGNYRPSYQWASQVVETPHGRFDVADTAQALLGVTDLERTLLFAPSNTLDDIDHALWLIEVRAMVDAP
jgi:hypothetical protein